VVAQKLRWPRARLEEASSAGQIRKEYCHTGERPQASVVRSSGHLPNKYVWSTKRKRNDQAETSAPSFSNFGVSTTMLLSCPKQLML
jgi:hypothetical protein